MVPIPQRYQCDRRTQNDEYFLSILTMTNAVLHETQNPVLSVTCLRVIEGKTFIRVL